MALNFAFTADNSNFMRALQEVTSGVRDVSRQIEAEGGNIEQFFTRIRNIGAISFAGFGLGEMINKIKDTRAYFQDIESSMKVFLGDAEKAADFTSKLQDYAYYNMYEFADLADASKQLIAYGNDVSDVTDIIQKLSEVGIATGQQLGEMVNLYNRAKSTGVVGSQDIASWASKGLILKDVMKEMGTYVEGQTISFKQLNEVLDKVTAEGGMFHGIQDAQMTNISANIGQLEDNLSLMFNEIGTHLQEPIYEVLQFGSDVIDHWKEVGFAMASLTASVGVQKGIELTTLAIDRTATQSMYASEIVQLKSLLPEKEKEEKTTLQQAVASGHLTEAKAAEIAALREEVEEYSKLLEKKEENAIAEALAAEKIAKDSKEVGEALIDANNSEIESLQEKIEANCEWLESLDENIQWLFEEAVATENATLAEQINTLATENNSIQEEINTAAQNANTASRNSSAISAEREAIAIGLETSATTKSTFASRVLIAAKTALTKAQMKLNAAIAANPYAIAIAAVAALAYGIYKLATYESDEAKRAKEINEVHNSLSIEYANERKKLDELAEKLELAKKGSEDWKKTKKELVDQYGGYLKNLDEEITKTGNLASSYEALTTAIKKSLVARKLEDYDQKHEVNYDDVLKDAQKRLASGYVIYNPLTKKNEKRTASEEQQKLWLDQLSSFLVSGGDTELDEELVKALKNSSTTWYGGKTSVWEAVKDILEESKKNNESKEKIAQRWGFSVDEVMDAPKPGKTYEDPRTEEEQLKKDIDAKKKEWHNIDKSTSEGRQKRAEIDKEIKELEKEYASKYGKTYDQANKKQSGDSAEQTASKIASEHQQLLDLIKRQAEERLSLRQDYEYQEWQNRIDLMEDGEAKVIAQMQLDHEKEQTELKGQKQQAIQAEIERQKALWNAREDEKAVGNKKYAKKVFNPVTDVDQTEIDVINQRYDNLYTQLLSKQEKAEQDRLYASQESFNAYLQEFGTYQQKREAIATDYDTRIAEAANAGDRMMLEAQKNKALSDLDYQQWIDSEEIALAFGDISNLSQQTISRLIEDMEKYREKVVATFDPDKIEKYEEALNNLRMADAENTFSAFGSMVPEYFTKRLAIQKQINDEAQIGLELTRKQNELSMQTEAQRGAVKIQAKATGYSISDEDLADPSKIQQIADKVAVASASGNKFASALHSALLELLKLNGESAELEKATQKWDGNFSHLKETLDNLEGEEKFNAICESVGSAAGLVGDLASQASEMADAMGAEGLGKALGTLGEAMGSVQNVASGFAQGGLVGGIAAAAGEVMKWTTKLFMAGDAKHQKNIERLQEQIDALEKSYEKVSKAADKAFSTDASKLINQQNTMLKQQQALIRQQIAEEEAKKKTDKDKIKEYQERLEEINELLEENAEKAKEAIVGTDIKSAIEELSSLYAGAWDDGTDAAQKSMQAVKSIISGALTELLKKNIQPAAQNFYDTLAKAMEDGILTDEELANLDTIKAQMDALAASGEEQYKKIQERYKDLDELREELTDISFDSVRDNFKSLLSDMESTTEDFTESFTDMLRNALINGLMDSKYDALLKEWYNDFAEAMNDQTLTDSERDALRQQYDAIVQQGIADRNAINAIVGGGAYSQQASSGSAWNMSQETGDELNGRFTAMVELEATNNVLVSDGNAIAREILVTLRSMSGLSMTVTGNGDNETLLAIKDMMFLSTGYLEDIAKYSKLLASISSDVSEMKSAVKDL